MDMPDDDPTMAKEVIKQLLSQGEFNKTVLDLIHQQNVVQQILMDKVLDMEKRVDALTKPTEGKQPPGYA